ncbi:MAG: hypothetical protein V4594_23150 [Bacteroidota bacterium]
MDNREFYLEQFKVLKTEELTRIGFRDNMIYISLVAIGTVFAFCLQKPEYDFGLLVLPFFCIIMGWTYFNNDKKVNTIGAYLNKHLIPILKDNDEVCSWGEFRKLEVDRIERKSIQLGVDISLFCLSSSVSIFAFFINHGETNWFYPLVAVIEFICIFYLATLFCKNYST